jgi:hypothetical protein
MTGGMFWDAKHIVFILEQILNQISTGRISNEDISQANNVHLPGNILVAYSLSRDLIKDLFENDQLPITHHPITQAGSQYQGQIYTQIGNLSRKLIEICKIANRRTSEVAIDEPGSTPPQTERRARILAGRNKNGSIPAQIFYGNGTSSASVAHNPSSSSKFVLLDVPHVRGSRKSKGFHSGPEPQPQYTLTSKRKLVKRSFRQRLRSKLQQPRVKFGRGGRGEGRTSHVFVRMALILQSRLFPLTMATLDNLTAAKVRSDTQIRRYDKVVVEIPPARTMMSQFKERNTKEPKQSSMIY